MEGDGPEIEYYREIEDLFASLRGTPHVLSPRDFQLLRSWWREEVPLAAVAAGLTEVFARQREREDADPVVSLSYCRHAVRRHTKRLSEMHIGGTETGEAKESAEATDELHRLTARLNESALDQLDNRPAVANVLSRIINQIELAGRDLPPDLLDQHLYGLESAMLNDCWLALPEEERRSIDVHVEAAAGETSTSEEARNRTMRALRDREIRLLLGLPRMELGS